MRQNGNCIELNAIEWGYLIRNLVNPSEEQRRKTIEYSERLNNHICITETETGFVVSTDLIDLNMVISARNDFNSLDSET